MSCNPLITVTGDTYLVWCRSCRWEHETSYLPAARHQQKQHKEK